MKIVIVYSILLMLLNVQFNIVGVYAWDAWEYEPPASEYPGGHNMAILNALKLLNNDGYDIEKDVCEKYLKALMDGALDADKGSFWHGSEYGVSGDDLFDMHNIAGTPFDGGGLTHFFDPWNHNGIGCIEDLYELTALINLVGVPLTLLVDPTLVPLFVGAQANFIIPIDNWRQWQGNNAAEGARKNFERAEKAWQEGNQPKAMYFLGYVLHLVADATVPYHAANVLYDPSADFSAGHSRFEGFAQTDIKRALANGDPIYNVSDNEHGIYLEDLRRLSDGIYISGDTDLLVDTESVIDELRYGGHIYQLDNPVYQFIDFAAHEAIQWYPLVNNEGMPDAYSGSRWDHAWEDFDEWWEIYNYIETRDLKKKSSSEDHISRLIFHFEGVDAVKVEFEGAWDNSEAIDMSNSWWTRLGYVEAYNDYLGPWGSNNKVGGPWIEEGWHYGGPEPQGHDTLQIETVVDRGNKYDDDCDGWQIAQISVHDLYHYDDLITDPLWTRKNVKYIKSDGYVGEEKDLPLLDDPLPMTREAQKIALAHMLDLSSKLCAGMIKYFMNAVGAASSSHPFTYVIPRSGIGAHIDESGKMYIKGTSWDQLNLISHQGRYVWSGSENKYVYQTFGIGLQSIGYQIDNGPWIWTNISNDGRYAVSEYITISNDEKPHTIRYYSINKEGEVEPEKILIYQRDDTKPTTVLTLGKPNKIVDDIKYIVSNTPITLNASDHGGSGVWHIYYSIYSVEEQKWVVGKDPEGDDQSLGHPWIWGMRYISPFTFKKPWYKWLYKEDIKLPAGTYRISYAAVDNVFHSIYPQEVEVELVDSIANVYLDIEPDRSTVQPGSLVKYNITIDNWFPTTETYDLRVTGLDSAWFWLSDSITLGPGQNKTIHLNVWSPYASLISKVYPFTVFAKMRGSQDVRASSSANLEVTYIPETILTPKRGLSIKVPEVIGIPPGPDITVNVTVINNENYDDLIFLGINTDNMLQESQAEVTWFEWTKLTVFIPKKNTMTLPLKITVPTNFSPSRRTFDILANSVFTESNAIKRVSIARAPIALPTDSYITVSPLSTMPGKTITIKGCNFLPSQKICIYLDAYDDFHKLGNVTCSKGKFRFTFTMSSNSVGEHVVYAQLEDLTDFVYSAKFTLKSTTPSDARLFTYIWDSLTYFYNSLMATLEGWFGASGKYSKMKQTTSGNGIFEVRGGNNVKVVYDPQPDPASTVSAYKITIIIKTIGLTGDSELWIVYQIGPEGEVVYETIARGENIDPAKTYTYCVNTEYPFQMGGSFNQIGDHFEVVYSYVVEKVIN